MGPDPELASDMLNRHRRVSLPEHVARSPIVKASPVRPERLILDKAEEAEALRG